MAEMLGVIKNGNSFLIGGGASAEDIGVRYDEENDVVQLYYNGQWRDWQSGGMAYPVGTETTFSYKGSVDSFEIPATGVWQIELFGAGSDSSRKGGKTILYEELQFGEILYICVGGTFSNSTGGYNGGGNGCDGGYGGCGATHVALMDGTLTNIGSLNLNKILGIAGGAGGSTPSSQTTGGNGGGITGQDGGYHQYGDFSGKGGTQSAGGNNFTGTISGGTIVGYATSATFGQGASGTNGNGYPIGGGGGGLYGGGASYYVGISGGGSGYIKNNDPVIIGNVTYTPTTTQGLGATSDGSCVFTYLGRAS